MNLTKRNAAVAALVVTMLVAAGLISRTAAKAKTPSLNSSINAADTNGCQNSPRYVRRARRRRHISQNY